MTEEQFELLIRVAKKLTRAKGYFDTTEENLRDYFQLIDDKLCIGNRLIFDDVDDLLDNLYYSGIERTYENQISMKTLRRIGEHYTCKDQTSRRYIPSVQDTNRGHLKFALEAAFTGLQENESVIFYSARISEWDVMNRMVNRIIVEEGYNYDEAVLYLTSKNFRIEVGEFVDTKYVQITAENQVSRSAGLDLIVIDSLDIEVKESETVSGTLDRTKSEIEQIQAEFGVKVFWLS